MHVLNSFLLGDVIIEVIDVIQFRRRLTDIHTCADYVGTVASVLTVDPKCLGLFGIIF